MENRRTAHRSSSLRITRLKLVNWRNFRDVDIRLGKRVFIVGPNASGKSNLLDALRFLRDVANPVGGGLSIAVERRGGLAKVRCLHARNPSHVEIDVDLGNDDNPCQWGYRLRFAQAGKGKDARLSALEEEIRQNGHPIESRSRPELPDDPLEYTQTLIQQVLRNVKFRPIADFFVSIHYLHVVPQVIRDSHRARLDEEDPFGGDLLRRIKDTPPKNREARLARLSNALKSAVPQFVDLKLTNDSAGHPHLEASFKHWRKPSARHDETMFSDGTLRLIGFLWSVSERGGPLLLEEPELSLNDSVIEQLPAMIYRAQRQSQRQVIATTHSTVLQNADGIGLDELHIITVDTDGSKVQTVADNPDLRMLIEDNWPPGDAIQSLTKPKDISQLSLLDLVRG